MLELLGGRKITGYIGGAVNLLVRRFAIVFLCSLDLVSLRSDPLHSSYAITPPPRPLPARGEGDFCLVLACGRFTTARRRHIHPLSPKGERGQGERG